MTGGSPTLESVLSGARSNAGRILPWALISAKVSIVQQVIQARAGFTEEQIAGAFRPERTGARGLFGG